MIRAFLRALLLSLTIAPAVAAAQTIKDETNLGASTHRSWPAGPYSQVSTGSGILQTSIPFFSLDGPGRSSMSFGLYHRSNQGRALMVETQGYAGAGWQPSTVNFVKAGTTGAYLTDPWQVKGGNSASHWHVPVFNGGQPSGYDRRPGTRADLARIMSGNTVLGFVVTEQADASKHYYERQNGGDLSIWYLTRVVDPRGNTVSYAYDSYNRVYRITDAAGRYASLTWGAGQFGQLLSVSLVAGGSTRTWSLEFWAKGAPAGHVARLRNVLFPAVGGVRPSAHFEYDAYDNVTDEFDARGANWHYAYDSVGQESPYTSLAVTNVYEPLATPPANYDPQSVALGNYDGTSPTKFAYFVNAPQYQTLKGFGGHSFYVRPQTYTGAVIDRLGRLWRHEYDYGVDTSGGTGVPNNDWLGNPIRVVYQPNVTGYLGDANHTYYETFTWDYFQGTLTRYVDAEGRITDMTYLADQSGLCSAKKQYLGATTVRWNYGYSNRRLVWQISPDNVTTDYTYNFATDELTSKAVDLYGLNVKTNFLYSAQGELTDTWTGNDAHAVSSNFDAYGNARTVADPGGNSTTLVYDAWGNKTSETPPAPLGTTTYVYDELNRLVQTNLPGGANVGAGYDLNGNAIQARKEDGTLVLTQYDAFNRPKSVTQPVDLIPSHDLVTGFTYNLLGERTSVTNPRGLITLYGFDARGQATGLTYPDGTTRQVGVDGVGAKRWVVNGRGQKTSFLYDALGRMTGIDYPVSADVAYGYSLEGRRLSMADGTGTSGYAYDTAGRPSAQTQGLTGRTLTTAYWPGTDRRRTLSDGAQTWTFGYDGALRLQSLGQTIGSATPATFAYRPSGALDVRNKGATKTQYGYDARGRATSVVEQTSGGATLESQAYGFGTDGNLLTYGRSGPFGSWTTTYAHDKADRLLSEVRSGPGVNYQFSFTYDANGNRASTTRNGYTSVYGAAGANDQVTTGEGYAFSSYDGDGNPGSVYTPFATTMGFVYDEAGRVTSITGSGASSFRYDGDGRRVERTVSGGAVTRFLYDGDALVAELSGSNAVLLYQAPAGGGFVRGGQQRQVLESPLGSSLAVRDASGTQVGMTDYDAFGQELYATGTDRGGSLRFAGGHGYQTDDGTGMQMLGARYYIPALGRFLTQDPIGHEGGLNLYAYCSNSPLSRVDPDGTQLEALRYSGGLGGYEGGKNIALTAQEISYGLASWPMAIQTATQWYNGDFPREIHYGKGSVMWEAYIRSGSAGAIENQIRRKNYMPLAGWMTGGVKSWPAYRHSLLESYNGAQWQAGAMSFYARRVGNRVDITAWNPITTESAFFHNPQWFGLPKEIPYGRPMGTVTQYYHWSIPIPRGK